MKLIFTAMLMLDAAINEQGGTAAILKAIDSVGERAEKSNQKLAEEVEQKMAKIGELETGINEAKSAAQKAQDAIELFEQKQATAGMGASAQQHKSFHQELGEVLGQRWKSDISRYMDNNKQKGFHFDLQAKAVGDMAAGNLTGSYYSAQQQPGIVTRPYETTHMRDILPVGQTDKDTIRYVVDNGGEGGPGMVAPGGLKPQMDRDLEIKDANVRKIAVYFRIPEEMVNDIPYIQSFLSQIGVEEVMAEEDEQILLGDGTGQNLPGIYTTAAAFARPTGVTTVADANEFDAIRAAQTQLMIARYQPAVAIIAPADFYNMSVTKDTTGNYVLQGGGNGLNPNFSGLRLLVQNTMTAGSFLVGDPRNTAIFDRAGTTVRVFEQDQDNAIRNLVTVVIEKRLALVNYRPNAWVKGTFAAAETALEAA